MIRKGDGGMAGEGNGDDAVIIALGGNLPGAWPSIADVLEAALTELDAVGLKRVARSSLWRSAAWPDPSQPEYLNAVALVETELEPRDVLAALQGLERWFGRVRSAANAARVLDLDLVAYGRLVIEDEVGGLILPHPRAAERGFVMGPLAEIAPHWRHPVSGERAADLAKHVTIGTDAAPLKSPPASLGEYPGGGRGRPAA
ncbi:MAG: 2-amino-4-hydroxy-6-hydroxymethyldihydropteridine diphosphokinase, partial [Caulobacteraceae bacterium]